MKEPIRASSFQAKSVQDTDWSSHTLIKLTGSPVGTFAPFTTLVKPSSSPGTTKFGRQPLLKLDQWLNL